MRWAAGLVLAFAVSGSACANEDSGQINLSETPTEKQDREFATQLVKDLLSVELAKITCTGVAQQGGAVLCQTEPNAKVKVARSEKDFYFEVTV